MKVHEEENNQYYELENKILCLILEELLLEDTVKGHGKILIDIPCDQCEFKTICDEDLKTHKELAHKPEKGKTSNSANRKIKCDKCIYECYLSVQMEKHIEKKHIEKKDPNYKCDLCDFGGDLITDIWSHKGDKHTEKTFDFNKIDEKKLFVNFMAEQNLELMEEMINFKNGMKLVLEHMVSDFVDTMKDLKEEVTKQNEATTKAIMDLQNKIENSNNTPSSKDNEAVKETKSTQPKAPSSAKASLSPPKASSSSSKTPSVPPPKAKAKPAAGPNAVKTPYQKKKQSTEYQAKPRVLYIGDSIAHNSNFRNLEKITNTTIKTSKAYSSVWDKDARFKHLNVMDVVKNELGKGDFDHLVLAAPTVDISNLDTSNVKPSDSTDLFKEKVGKSCQNMLKVAQDALENHTGLKNITIMNHAPRFDSKDVDPVGLKPILANFANSYLLELWLDSPKKNNIFIGSHNLNSSVNVRHSRYTDDRTGRFDGVHLYGSAGKTAYTDSVLNILLSSLQVQAQASKSKDDGDHTWCP